MSKLIVVLCAATFLALATAATTINGKNIEAKYSIDQAIKSINNRVKKTEERVSELGPEPSVDNWNIVEEFDKNITQSIENVRSVIDGIIERTNIDFYRTKCKNDFDEFEKTGEAVREELDAIMILAEATTPFSQIFGVSRKLTNGLKDQIEKADQCSGNECNEIIENALKTSRDFDSTAAAAFDTYMAYVNGSYILNYVYKKLDYKKFLAKKNHVTDDINSCVHSCLSSNRECTRLQ